MGQLVEGRISGTVEVVTVLFTDLAGGVPDRVLKTVPVQHVTVAQDKTWVGGGDRLVRVPLADGEIRPRRQFALRFASLSAVSAASVTSTVPAQLLTADDEPFETAGGRPFIPAPSA